MWSTQVEGREQGFYSINLYLTKKGEIVFMELLNKVKPTPRKNKIQEPKLTKVEPYMYLIPAALIMGLLRSGLFSRPSSAVSF